MSVHAPYSDTQPVAIARPAELPFVVLPSLQAGGTHTISMLRGAALSQLDAEAMLYTAIEAVQTHPLRRLVFAYGRPPSLPTRAGSLTGTGCAVGRSQVEAEVAGDAENATDLYLELGRRYASAVLPVRPTRPPSCLPSARARCSAGRLRYGGCIG